MVQQEILGDYSDLPNMLAQVSGTPPRVPDHPPQTHPNISQWEQNSQRANPISQASLLPINGFHLSPPFYVKGIWNNSNLPQRNFAKKTKHQNISAADLS